MKITELLSAVSLPPLVLMAAFVSSSGCENTEKVLDVETPAGQAEIERNRDTGEINVQATEKDDQVIDSDIPGADVEVNHDDETGDVQVE